MAKIDCVTGTTDPDCVVEITDLGVVETTELDCFL